MGLPMVTLFAQNRLIPSKSIALMPKSEGSIVWTTDVDPTLNANFVVDVLDSGILMSSSCSLMSASCSISEGY
jgi:hypothetical protein